MLRMSRFIVPTALTVESTVMVLAWVKPAS